MTSSTLLISALVDEMKFVAERKPNAITRVTGVGAARMTAAVSELIDQHHPSRVILIGFSGGLTDASESGDVIHATAVINTIGDIALLGDVPRMQRSDGSHDPGTTLLTVDRIVTTREEKRKLGEVHRAIAVDMESFYVAKLCAERSTNLTILRAISDSVNFTMPPQVGDWVNPDGSSRISAVMRSLAWKPSLMPALLALQSSTKHGSKNLAAAVMKLLH